MIVAADKDALHHDQGVNPALENDVTDISKSIQAGQPRGARAARGSRTAS